MWIETSEEVYAVIFAKHKKQLRVHSSYSDQTGTNPFTMGTPTMETEWGFEQHKNPLLKIVQTKKDSEQKDWDVEVFIYSKKSEDA